MRPEFWFVIYVFAVYRLAELISHDLIFESVRQWTGRRAAAGKRFWIWVADWMRCPLCIGVWLSFPAAFLFVYTLFAPFRLDYMLVVWMGVAGAQYLLSNLTLDNEDN